MIALVIAAPFGHFIGAHAARGKSINTPAHLIFRLTAFGRTGRPAVTTAALVGALIPDLSLCVLSVWNLLTLGNTPEVVFGQLYYSNNWQSIFRIDNSVILWGFDFLLHNDDGRAHFWPLRNWVFQSPVSYWDPDHYGNVAGAVEVALLLLCCGILWQRFVSGWMRGLVVMLGASEFAPFVVFGVMFAGA